MDKSTGVSLTSSSGSNSGHNPVECPCSSCFTPSLTLHNEPAVSKSQSVYSLHTEIDSSPPTVRSSATASSSPPYSSTKSRTRKLPQMHRLPRTSIRPSLLISSLPQQHRYCHAGAATPITRRAQPDVIARSSLLNPAALAFEALAGSRHGPRSPLYNTPWPARHLERER